MIQCMLLCKMFLTNYRDCHVVQFYVQFFYINHRSSYIIRFRARLFELVVKADMTSFLRIAELS